MLSHRIYGQGLPAADAQRILEENGFLLQKLDCNSYSVNENSSGTEGAVRYFPRLRLKERRITFVQRTKLYLHW